MRSISHISQLRCTLYNMSGEYTLTGPRPMNQSPLLVAEAASDQDPKRPKARKEVAIELGVQAYFKRKTT